MILLRLYQTNAILFENLVKITNQNLYADFQKETSGVKLERLRRLRKIAQLQHSSPLSSPIVIIGIGPAGLSRGIVAALQGYQPRFFEIRESQTEGRSNVIVLGHHPLFNLDISLLRFLGVLERLEEKHQTSSFHNYTTVMIKHLETALKEVLLELLEGAEGTFNYQHFLAGVQRLGDDPQA